MSSRIGVRQMKADNYALVLKKSKRDFFSFHKNNSPVRSPSWDEDLLREFLICVHDNPDIDDVYLASGEEVSVRCSKGNLPISLEDGCVPIPVPSNVLQTFFQSVNIDFFSVVRSGGRMSVRVQVVRPGKESKCTFRLEVCSYSNGPESMSAAGVLRPNAVPPLLKDLNIHPLSKSIESIRSGMILFLGATGTGKSTSIFSILLERARVSSETIITIEDPIEYDITSPKSKQSRVFQFDISDMGASGFTGALHSLVRMHPDTVLVGEMRDLASVEAALAVSRSGHQLFSTVHVDRPWNAPNRIFEIIHSEGTGRTTLMMDFITNLRVMVAQKLIPNLEGGKTAIQDVLILSDEDKLLLFKTFSCIQSKSTPLKHEDVEFYSVADAIRHLTFRNEAQGRGITMETMLEQAWNAQQISELVYRSEIEKLAFNVLE